MATNTGKLDKYVDRSRRAGGFRSIIKRGTAKKARRISREIIKDDDNDGCRIITGYAS